MRASIDNSLPRIDGWMEQEISRVQKQTQRCAFLNVLHIGFVIWFILVVLLLKFEFLEVSSIHNYLGMPEDQLSMRSVTNASGSVFHVDAEEAKAAFSPKNLIERAKDPLFILSTISKFKPTSAEYAILCIWKYLIPVFTRSDCFPEAKRGLKKSEASWEELMETIKLDNMQAVNQSSHDVTEKKCPYSVSSLDSADFKNFIEIPCGLVVHSSITVVAMPWGTDSNFAIELLGPKLPGQMDPPIVLHFNLSLQGDKISNGSVIVQNTWDRDHDWGDEERCPSQEKVRKVDGMDTCSDRIGKKFLNDSLEVKDHTIDMKSPESVVEDKQLWLPFISGLPFASTLWVGWQGFHMTLNGKPVTSFEYRENLKPSLVGGVRLKGSIKPISMMATGLPASGDIAQVDLKYLKAPPMDPKKEAELFIGVFSFGHNFHHRMAIRRSWMQYQAIRLGHVTVRFFVGQHFNKHVNKKIWKEALMYGDIQLMPFMDYYKVVTLKTIAVCIFGTEIVRAKYIMKTDDDTFVRVDEVLSLLNKAKTSKGLLLGLMKFDSKPHRDRSSKWYIKEEEWSPSYYPPYAQGSGYVISMDIAKFVAEAHYNSTLKLLQLEDVSMGIWINEFQKRGHKVHYVNDDHFYNLNCSQGYVIAHYQSPKHMACLWRKLQDGLGSVCCE